MTDIAGWMKSVERRLAEYDRRIRGVGGAYETFVVNTPNMPLAPGASGKVQRIGKLVLGRAEWVMGGAVGSSWWLDLPYAVDTTYATYSNPIGVCGGLRAGVTDTVGILVVRSTTTAVLTIPSHSGTNGSGAYSNTFPATWQVGDRFFATFQYFTT